MDKKENKNSMLSFDKLREGLGIEGDLPQAIEDKSQNETTNNGPVVKKVVPKTGKSVFENGINFIDITEQYTTPQQPIANSTETKVVKEEKVEQVVELAPEKPKKRVKTFNEIFSDFFGVFFPVKADSAKEKMRKIVMDVSIILIVACIIGFVQLYIERSEQSSQEANINVMNITESLNCNYDISF